MKKYPFIFIFISVFSLFARGNDGRITIDINSDSLVIEHIGAWRNCAASYLMDIEIVDSTIYLMEKDTSKGWTTCYCYFDLRVTVTTPPPAIYRLIIQTCNRFLGDTSFIADTTFIIGTVPLLSFSEPECMTNSKKDAGVEIPLLDHYESECRDSQNKSLYATSYGDNLKITWYADSLNPNIMPKWNALLSNDTLHLSMLDTGAVDDSVCSKYLTAHFGPLPAGKYILDYLDGELGYPTFIIDEQIVLETDGNDLIINWDIAELNCCLETQWEGWLDGNTFHVTMTDIGAPCDCFCPFELTARFGPFQPGEYILDFQNTNLGLFSFTIAGQKNVKSLTVLSSYQSDCYQIVTTGDDSVIPNEFALLYCYPNPFNSISTIEYFIPKKNTISIQVFDINGRQQQILFQGDLDPGGYSIQWNAAHFSSGIYFVILQGKDLEIRKKVLLLK